jgi:DNA polymerase (family 10)
MDNKELAGRFKLLADLIDLTGGNDFKAKSYQSAAFKLSKWPADIFSLPDEEISSIQGIGAGILAKIRELKENGSVAEMDALLEQVPAGVVEMLSIKGIGAKKVRLIWQELEIESVGELLYACHENRLAKLKGFGEKTQAEVVKAIEFKLANLGRLHYYKAEAIANTFLDAFSIALDGRRVEITGEVRRKMEVVDEIEWIAEDTAADVLVTLLNATEGTSQVEVFDVITFRLNSTYKCKIHLVPAEEFTYRLWETTGSALHIQLVRYAGEETVETEEEIYESRGLNYIVPELREGRDEVELAATIEVSEGLIEYEDIKGMLHNHSTYSDGLHTLREMALYCKEQGWEYLGICDHSQTAVYAGGLKPDKVAEQHAEIDKLNIELAPFKILKGIESDVLGDGSLDYSEEVLNTFDFVVASIHQGFKMSEEQATARIIKAIENPHTTILGHLTGRLLLSRPGYPVNHEAIIDACAKNGVVIEINANPYRLDMDWRWIKYATDKGVMISINPDAHTKEGYHDTYFGVCAARKGYLQPSQTFNCLSLNEMEEYLAKRKQRIATNV